MRDPVIYDVVEAAVGTGWRQKSGPGLGAVCVLGTVLALASPPNLVQAEPVQTHRYHLVLNDELGTLTVRAELAARTRSLRSRHAAMAQFVSGQRSCAGEPLRRDGRSIELPPGVDCLVYRYDLAGASGSQRRSWVQLHPSNLLVKPANWLFRPRLSEGSEILLTLDLPHGSRASVPWSRGDSGEGYRLGPSPASSDAIVALGEFDYREIPVPGAVLRVSLLKGEEGAMDADKMVAWLRQAATGVALAHGRFPNPNPQVIVVPARGSRNSPVPFGRVIRDGGEAVQFFVDPERSLQEYLDDWTATHEFSHLLLPYVRDRWVSEGFASYYQNVLMARSGRYSEAQAWRKLHAGIERARAVRPVMSPAETAGRGRKPRMMVYWSGAALALLGDVRQRQLSGGQESLEVVLGRLADCCLPSETSWDAQRFFTRLDELSQHKVWLALYRRHASTPGVADLSDLYRQLGVRIRASDELELDDSAPEAGLRRALMGPARSTAERIR